ncbi:heat-shock protein [Acinetobacter sp. SFD]|uniref:Hsp20 family protein n=1 Tax=Acinetobacter sp. SFD TaxID=1805635 RepID=UPI0007D097C7|nr:Hsp20 family protein [Acinetobacter sp. SFD]OAL83267.1 heat-shock protein [Acinetobacter sp. SFD]
MSNSNLSPLLRRSMGFDRFNDLFDYALQTVTPNYPYYNVEKVGENDYRISVATAGFNEDQLQINVENQLLIITGNVEEESSESTVEFLHKGISKRSFKLSLRLDDNMEVQQANYENGLLTIDLKRNIDEENMSRQIPIGRKSNEQKMLDDSKADSNSESQSQSKAE